MKQNIAKRLESLVRLTVLGLNYSVITCWNHRDETILFFLKYIWWGGVWVGYGVKRHLLLHFSYIAGVSFIGGGNQRKALTCLKSLTTFKYPDSQIYHWWKPEYLMKTTDLLPVTDKLYDIILYLRHLAWEGIKLTTLVAITTMTAPLKYVANRKVVNI